jgi:hypothetical protein
MKVWVSRNKEKEGFSACYVRIWKTKPELNTYVYVSGRESPEMLRVEVFESLFEFTPRKGSCKHCNLTLTEIKK